MAQLKIKTEEKVTPLFGRHMMEDVSIQFNNISHVL